jgi:hypothetical protein
MAPLIRDDLSRAKRAWGAAACLGYAISRRTALPLVLAAGLAWTGAVNAARRSFKITLTGTENVPPMFHGGFGQGEITWDSATRKLTWAIIYNSLTSPVTVANFHGPARPGQNAPAVIWLTSKRTPAPKPLITGSATLTPEQAQQLSAGLWYIELYTEKRPVVGELRGQVVPPKG